MFVSQHRVQINAW